MFQSPATALEPVSGTNAGAPPALDRALATLTEAARALLGADVAVVVARDARDPDGTVRSAAGPEAPPVGSPAGPGWDPDADGSRCVSVPLDGVFDTRLWLSAAWTAPPSPEARRHAGATLGTLAGLTRAAARAEVELSQTRDEARLDAVLECVGDGVWIETAEGAKVNNAARELLGLGDGDTVRDLDTRLRTLDGTQIPDDERPHAQAIATRKAVPFLHRRTRLDGAERVFQGTAVPVYDHGREDPAGTVVTFRDVTEEYNRSFLTERFLEELFEALPLAVGVTDPATGEMLSANRAFGRLVGRRPEEMLGELPPYPWWADGPDAGAAPRPDDAPTPREALFRRRDGRLVPVEIVPLLVSEASGEPAAAVTLITDLSERRRFEQEMVQSGKLAAIGELAAGVAHEINNPLFAILGLVEFLLKEVEPGTKAHERLELVQQTGLEIKEVVRALLDFARERSNEFEPVALADVLRQTVDLLRRTSLRKEIELLERYPDEPLSVVASAGQLKQVVLNLVTNAQQAMDDTGAITIELERAGSYARVSVRDTGPGIAPEVFERIFDPFFTTKRELGGTGLGLPLSQSIADAHGGTLVVASPSGGGAEFVLTLPLAQEAP